MSSKDDMTGAAGLGEIIRRLSDLFDHMVDLKEGEVPKHGRREKNGMVFEYSFGKRGAEEAREARAGRAPFAEAERPRPEPRRAAPRRAARPVGATVLEPVTDIFDEPDEVLLLVELPGAARKDVRCVLDGDILLIEAGAGERLFRKEVLIEADLAPGEPQVALRNGVLQVRLAKAAAAKAPAAARGAKARSAKSPAAKATPAKARTRAKKTTAEGE
jgi:HSP20 family protein